MANFEEEYESNEDYLNDGFIYNAGQADTDYFKKRREQSKKLEKEKKVAYLDKRNKKISEKGGYKEPDYLDIDIYNKYVEDVAKNSDKKYDLFDAESLRNFMYKFRQFYPDTLYRYCLKYYPEKIKKFPAFYLDALSGNDIVNDEIVFDNEKAEQAKKEFISAETKLAIQRTSYYTFQTHHPRTGYAIFKKKKAFLQLQKHAAIARIMNYMLEKDFDLSDAVFVKTKFVELEKNNIGYNIEMIDLQKRCEEYVEQSQQLMKDFRYQFKSKEGETLDNMEVYENLDKSELFDTAVGFVGGLSIKECKEILKQIEEKLAPKA